MKDEDGQIRWRGGREVRSREVTGEFGLALVGMFRSWEPRECSGPAVKGGARSKVVRL